MLWPFLITTVTLFALGIISGNNVSFVIIVILFIIYGIFNTAMGCHQWIYPYELYPTHVRGTGGGFTTTISRIASAISTFFFPLLLSQLGLSITLYIAGGLLFIGFIVSYFLAPETKNMNLTEAATITKA